MRESGYYWVRFGNEWLIAQFGGKFKIWFIFGRDDYFTDSRFDEIDERHIVREVE